MNLDNSISTGDEEKEQEVPSAEQFLEQADMVIATGSDRTALALALLDAYLRGMNFTAKRAVKMIEALSADRVDGVK